MESEKFTVEALQKKNFNRSLYEFYLPGYFLKPNFNRAIHNSHIFRYLCVDCR